MLNKMKQFIFNWTKATVIIILITSCTNVAYKRVATDVDRSDKNKSILRTTCESVFPPIPAQFIEGKTIIKTDTVIQVDTLIITDSVTSEKIAYITKYQNIVTERLKTDTVIKYNTYQIDGLNSIIEAQKLDINTLEVRAEYLEQTNRKNKVVKWSGWFVVIASIGLFLLKIYLQKFYKL